MRTHSIVAVAIFSCAVSAFAGETNYRSPINGKSYGADWRTYNPPNTPASNTPARRVRKQGVRLLSTQDEFRRSIDVAEFSDFIRKTEQAIDSSLGATNDTFELVIQTKLTKDKKRFFEMGSKGDVSQDVLQKIYDGFSRLPDYRSRKDDLMYEIRFTIASQP